MQKIPKICFFMQISQKCWVDNWRLFYFVLACCLSFTLKIWATALKRGCFVAGKRTDGALIGLLTVLMNIEFISSCKTKLSNLLDICGLTEYVLLSLFKTQWTWSPSEVIQKMVRYSRTVCAWSCKFQTGHFSSSSPSSFGQVETCRVVSSWI